MNLVVMMCAGLMVARVVAAQTNPVPSLDLPASPMGAAPGAAQFTLTATGTGFVRGSTVTWNGVALQTTYISGTKIGASVPAANLTAATGAVIAVTQPGGFPVSNGMPFEVGNSESAVTLGRADYSIGLDSQSIVTADFNGDGILDLAVVSNSQSNFTVLLGHGDGTFTVQGSVGVATTPGYAAVGDFNNDGHQDLTISGVGAVYVFPGNGDGTFGAATEYTLQADDGPLAVGDFNGDGVPDIATTDATTGTVSVLVNGVATNYTVGSMPEGVVAADLNRDGRLDLAVANYASASISVLLGKGDGTFRTPAATISTTDGPWALLAVDTSNDSKLDLVVATPGYTQTENKMVVLLGNGDGTFKTPVGYNVAGNPVALAAGDFNNDLKVDVAVAAESGDAICLLEGTGNGVFKASQTYKTPAGVAALAAGDFNKDGALDLAGSYSNGASASVFLQQTTGSPVATLNPTSLLFPLTVVSTSSSSLPVTLTNSGNAALTISSITPSTQFSQTNDCGSSLAAGSSCTINVVFTPQHQGTQTGTLTVTDNAAGSPQTVSLQGQGEFFVVSPLSLTFETAVGTTSSPQLISIYGEDSTPEKVSFSVYPLGDTSLFPYTNTCNGYVPSHATCTVSISFAPTASGTVNATFQITGGGGVTKVSMTGTGQ